MAKAIGDGQHFLPDFGSFKVAIRIVLLAVIIAAIITISRNDIFNEQAWQDLNLLTGFALILSLTSVLVLKLFSPLIQRLSVSTGSLLGRTLLGLAEAIPISVLDPDWSGPTGWVFGEPPAATRDHVNGLASLPEVYRKANPRFTGKVTVPALWDRKRATIVNNESAEILRMLGTEFRALTRREVDLYPEPLRAEIDRINDFVGPRINGGVYRAGFASTQEAYDAAVIDLFAALDALEEHMDTREFLVGSRLSEADLRLFPTLVRFDVAYYGALRCNLRRLVDYPHLLAYTRRMYALPGVAETVKLDHVKRHYWDHHPMIERRILPIGPSVDFGPMPTARAA
jgi:putative glutathione S-transferase